MRTVNSITVIGKLLAPPVVRRPENSAPVANFELETVDEWMSPRGPQRREVVHTCVAFGPVANSVEGLGTGAYVYVDGSMRADREAGDNYAFEIVCSAAIPFAEPSKVRELIGTEQEQ